MISAKTEFRAKAVSRAAKIGSFKSLKHAGFGLRQTARRLVKKSKKSSQPGTPPHTRGRPGGLKKVMAVAIIDQAHVDVGPENTRGPTIWSLHEFGGRSQRKARQRKRATIGGTAPLTLENFKLGARVRIRTQAQADRANEILDRQAQLEQAVRNYPPRPFMKPALAWDLPRMPANWKGSIQGQ